MSEAIATTIALIKKDIENIFKDVEVCITQKEFDPIRRIVYGIVGLALTSLAIAVFNLVIKQ